MEERVKDQIEYFIFEFLNFFLSKYSQTLLDLINIDYLSDLDGQFNLNSTEFLK
jgi:hypothetical protein